MLAIVAVLSAILFPIMRGAKASANKANCLTNFSQVLYATYLYQQDYDDRFMPVNYVPSLEPDPKVDATWVQLMLPYTRNMKVFRCSEDRAKVAGSDAIFDGGSVPGDTIERFYLASLKVNIGYNYLYYSPVYWAGDRWVVQTRSGSEVQDPAKATIFIDTVAGRDENGNPMGGGSYVAIPPCRYFWVNGQLVDSFGVGTNHQVFTASKGWRVNDPISALRYGFAYPWHFNRLSIVRLAGGAKTITTSQLAAGCDVKLNWLGLIKDRGAYGWDLN